MDLSYLDYENPIPIIRRQLYTGDMLILYSPSSISILDNTLEYQKNIYIHPLTEFVVVNDIITDSRSGVDKGYICVSPSVNGHLFKGVSVDVPPIKLKVDIGNIKYILNEDQTEDGIPLSILDTFKIGSESCVDAFGEEIFPLSEIDKHMERDDRKLLDLYALNIKNHYACKEMEIELRCFQNEYKYGGYSNTLNSFQYKKLVDTFNKSSQFYNLTRVPNETLDITVLNNKNLRITIEGRDKILRYCTTNTIPKTANIMYKSFYAFKEDPGVIPDDTRDYYRHNFDRKTDTDLRRGVFNLYSLRTKLGGKIEIPFENKKGKYSLNEKSLSNNVNIKEISPKAKASLNDYQKLVRQRGNGFLKTYRLKSRMSFMLNNYLRIDLTKVKDSKKEVRQIGSTFRSILGATKNFIDAEVVEQDEQYEFEIEIINLPEDNDLYGEELKKQLSIALNIIKYSNAIINERPCFTHTNMKDNVLSIYKEQVHTLLQQRYNINKTALAKERIKFFNERLISNYYISPKVNSLTLNHVQPPSYPTFINPETGKEEAGEQDYTKYTDSVQVRYCVTDKADGLASMLFVYGVEGIGVGDVYDDFSDLLTGHIFMLDSNLNVYYTGLTIDLLEEEEKKALQKLIREKNELLDKHEQLLVDIDNKQFILLDNLTEVKLPDGTTMHTNKKQKPDYSEEDAWDVEVMESELDVVLETLEYKRNQISEITLYEKGKWSLFNGEYLNYDKERNIMNSFAMYDAYVYGGRDIYNLPLITRNEINPENPGSRIGHAYTFLECNITQFDKSGTNWLPFKMTVKNFETPNQEGTVVDSQSSDTIFSVSNRIWSRKDSFEYKLDGLIYTPINESVSFQPDSDLYQIMPWKTWTRNLKWKPPEDNTIDFLIKFRRTETEVYNGKSLYKKVIKGRYGSKKRYCVVDLYNKGKIGHKWKPILFKPKSNTIDKDDIMLEINANNDIIDQEGFVVNNDTIVEISYEPDKPVFERFSILRTRHEKTYQYLQLINHQKTEFLMVEKALNLKGKRRLNHIEQKFVSYITKKYFTKKRGRFQSDMDTIEKCEAYYQDYTDIQTNQFEFNFGNSNFVALRIWDSIHNPVTEEMITTGENIPTSEESSDVYYLNSGPRNQSKTFKLQKFHNFIKKNILIRNTVKLLYSDGILSSNVRLLDLGCGKGGDIWKWRSAKIPYCVGIDISEDNIVNSEDGALVRYGKMKDSGGFMPTIKFLQLDVSKSFIEHLPEDFTVDTKFNIITSMYALHYCFKNSHTRDGIIDNIANHLERGGYFVGTCFNGEKVFNMLRGRSSLSFKVEGETILKIEKGYTETEFIENDSLGLKIDITMHSIGTTNSEYLVNFDHLVNELAKREIRLVEKKDYEDILEKHRRGLSFTEKQISNLNMYFIFKKNKASSPGPTGASGISATQEDSPPYIPSKD